MGIFFPAKSKLVYSVSKLSHTRSNSDFIHCDFVGGRYDEFLKPEKYLDCWQETMIMAVRGATSFIADHKPRGTDTCRSEGVEEHERFTSSRSLAT